MNAQFAPADAPVLVVEPAAGCEPAVAAVLARAGIAVETCPDLDAALARLSAPAGALVFGEEALTGPVAARLAGIVQSRSACPAPPLVVLTGGGEPREIELSGASIILADRTARPAILVSAVRAALRERHLQLRLGEPTGAQEAEAHYEDDARFRSIVEQASDGIFVTDARGRYVDVNTAGCEMLGYSRAELLERSIADVIVPDDVPRIPVAVARVAGGAVVTSEWNFRRKDGTVFPGEVRGRQLPDGRLQAILRDDSERRQVDAALREAERRVRLAVEGTGLGIWTAAPETNRFEGSARALDLHGFAADAQPSFDQVLAAIHPDDRAHAAGAVERTLASGGAFASEYRVPLRDGGVRWVSSKARLEPGEDGGLLHGVVYDVTEHKRAEQQLFGTNQRLQALMQSLTVGVSFSDDTSCQRVTGNPMLLAQFEMSPQDNVSASAPEETAAGRRVRYFHEGRELGGAELPLQRAVAENQVIPPTELEILLPGGRRWFAEVSGAPLRDARGTVIGGLAVIADITQRKHAEEALRKSEERLLLAQAAAGLGIYDYDVATGEIRWDARMRELWGVGPGTPIRAETALDALHPDDRTATQALIDKALDPEGGGSYYAEYRIVHPARSTVRWVAATGKVTFENRRPVRFLGTVQDITAHKLAENRLRELNAELAALVAERTRLAEKRTAELRELARDLTRAEQRERDRLYELLHDNVQPLLVAGRLALSALDERTPMEKWTRVATQTVRLIGEALETARSLGAELNPPVIRDQGLGPALDWLRQWVQARHGLEVVLDRDASAEPDDLPTRLLCFKAVRELLLNVAKHAGADRVELRTHREDDGMLRITVVDRGSGFDPAILGTANGGGVGSGLGNIERRLGMIGGRMQIGSRPGEGTAVTLLVPLQPLPPAEVAAPAARRTRARGPRAKKAAGEPPQRQ